MMELAEQGNSEAQLNLGITYYKGREVTKDHKKAIYWLTKSAEQGHPDAQVFTGMMYANGHGVNQDYTTACMWFNISTFSVDPKAKELGSGLVQSLSPLMTPEQMEVAEQMAKDWVQNFENKKNAQ